VREEFTVRFLNPAQKVDGAGRYVLDLVPKAPTPLLTRLVLSIDPKDYIVRQAVLYDQLQNTVTMTFTKVTPNAGLQDSLFVFTPPAGAAVVPLEIR
jgi:outer membrane lipoprotein-sorting protein